MITNNFIKQCEQAPKELWDGINHIGTLMAWRSFRGIVKPCEKRGELKGLAAFIPETLVTRTWLKNDEDIMVTEIGMEYPGIDGDKGTPVYSLEQLFEMVDIIEHERLAITKFENGYCVSKDDFYVSEISKSIHECFLEIVMITKYNKIWTGEKWEC